MRSNSIIATLLVLAAATHSAIATDIAVDDLAAHNTLLKTEENSKIPAGIYSSLGRQSTRKDGSGFTHGGGKHTHGLEDEDAGVDIFLLGEGEGARDHVFGSSTMLPSSGGSGRRVCHRHKQKMGTTGDSQQKHNGEAEEDHGAIAAAGPRRVCHRKAKATQIPDQNISEGELGPWATATAGPRRVCRKKSKATPIPHQEPSLLQPGHVAIAAAGPPRVCHKKAKATSIPDQEPLAGKVTSVKAKGVCGKKTKMPKAVHVGRCKRHMHAAGSDEFVPEM